MFRKWWIKQEEATGADQATGGGSADASGVDAAATTLDKADTSGGADASGKGAVDDKGAQADIGKQLWPDDWRKNIAGDDEKELKQLNRYASPADLWKKARSLEARLSSGELKPTLPKDAKPEEITQWRKDNGIPESADKYELKLENNLVIGDKDKPFVDEFMKTAHELNMTPAQVNKVVQWNFENQARQAEVRSAQDETDRQAALDTLNKEWGGNFRQNLNMVGSLLTHFPASVQETIKSARLPDGTALFNNPDIVRGFTAMALEINPAGTIVPAGGGDVAKSVDDEISSIEKTMRENRKEYTKNEPMQARYRELIDARIKLRERKAA